MNETLIEEAAKAIQVETWEPSCRGAAEAAFRVFEKAHTTTPPDGWFYMGSHVGAPWLNLEFSEEMDETGLPLWERPVQHTPTDSKPVAYGVYGRATGNLKYVQVMDAREVEEQSEFYDVVPLFAIPAVLRTETVGGNEREALTINYCPEHGDLLNRPGDGADARSYRCRNAHGIDEIHAGFRRSEEPETAPELFPGTLDALDSLTIRKEEA